jgi:hypothetical protein
MGNAGSSLTSTYINHPNAFSADAVQSAQLVQDTRSFYSPHQQVQPQLEDQHNRPSYDFSSDQLIGTQPLIFPVTDSNSIVTFSSLAFDAYGKIF